MVKQGNSIFFGNVVRVSQDLIVGRILGACLPEPIIVVDPIEFMGDVTINGVIDLDGDLCIEEGNQLLTNKISPKTGDTVDLCGDLCIQDTSELQTNTISPKTGDTVTVDDKLTVNNDIKTLTKVLTDLIEPCTPGGDVTITNLVITLDKINTMGISFDDCVNVLSDFIDCTPWVPVSLFDPPLTITSSAGTIFGRVGNKVKLIINIDFTMAGSTAAGGVVGLLAGVPLVSDVGSFYANAAYLQNLPPGGADNMIRLEIFPGTTLMEVRTAAGLGAGAKRLHAELIYRV